MNSQIFQILLQNKITTIKNTGHLTQEKSYLCPTHLSAFCINQKPGASSLDVCKNTTNML